MTLVPAMLPGKPVRNGLPGFRPYVYRGRGYDTLTPELGDPFDFENAPRPEGRCYCDGSMRAYRRHLALGEDPCKSSRDGVNFYHRTLAARKRLRVRRS